MPTMPKILISLTFSMIFGMIIVTNAYGENKKTEYFSYATLCNSKNNVTETKLLDFIESKILRNQEVNPAFLIAKTEEEIFNLLNENLKKLSPLRSRDLIETYLQLKSTMVISDGISIAAPVEIDNLINLNGCTLVPIAASMQILEANDNIKNRIIINKKIWEQLKLYEQVAVILDFAHAEEIQEENLIPARIFSGYWFSDSFKSMNSDQWDTLTESLHLPYFEFHGVKVTNLATQTSADLYKKNYLTINKQKIKISGYIRFYPETMNIESISIVEPVTQKISPESTIYLYGLENKYTSDGNMFFFDTPLHEIKSALYKTDKPIKINGHEIEAVNPKRNFEIAFRSPNVIWHIDASSAKVKIRNKTYSVVSHDNEGDYDLSGNVWFYPNGEIGSASFMAKNQTFDNADGKHYTNDHMHVMDFDSNGFPGNFNNRFFISVSLRPFSR